MTTAAKNNPLRLLHKEGQSIWLDNIRRQLITSGELARLRDAGVTGVTSNPTIFEKAVSGSTDYDEALVHLVRRGRRPEAMLWDLMVEDIQAGADVLRPVFDSTKGRDGYVSIEVSPVVARSTKRTIGMAVDLHRRTDRPNVMVKIPATRPGLPAIQHMIALGHNINVTLIFSVERYTAVVESYLAGLEELQQKGGDLSQVASVASFFVSRIDSKADKLIQARIDASSDLKERKALEGLLGKVGIANSKMAYERFKELHSGPRWESLKKAGARPQRVLWASTSVKDPSYPDTMYVEELIGPDTVDTVPPATLAAFQEHGEVRRSLDENVDHARRQLQQLEAAGISLDQITEACEVEGVDLFVKSFDDLMKVLKQAAKDIRSGKGPTQWHSLGTLQPAVDEAARTLQGEEAARRLWAKDPTLWSPERTRARELVDRLGWLSVPEKMEERVPRLREVARECRSYSDVVLLGMGGSSLGPDVLRLSFGTQKGHPQLHVLDTTDPGSILALRRKIDPAATLFVVASKSGETTETLSHFAYFWGEVSAAPGRGAAGAGRNFAAITDPGTSLEKLAREHDFRYIFQNPPDIGGRYSVLSYFGLVPGALMGVEVAGLLQRAGEMAAASAAGVEAEKNPGLWLGAVLGSLAKLGHNKLTVISSPRIASFGYWVEQLIAESTGKHGQGIVPVEGEPIGAPDTYGEDRLFVYVRMDKDAPHPGVLALERAGQPVVTFTLRDRLDLGAEFLRWEIATAIAGSILGIDPFDQPNVQESKDNTKKVLAEFRAKGRLPAVNATAAADAAGELASLLAGATAGSYFAIMAYTARSATSERALRQIREAVRDRFGMATTSGYGPRFLHSTGQLHKGGPKTGIFLQIVQEDVHDLQIPGQPYGFSILKQSQALGDLQSLRSRKYPVLRVSLGRRPGAGWKALVESLQAAIK